MGRSAAAALWSARAARLRKSSRRAEAIRRTSASALGGLAARSSNSSSRALGPGALGGCQRGEGLFVALSERDDRPGRAGRTARPARLLSFGDPEKRQFVDHPLRADAFGAQRTVRDPLVYARHGHAEPLGSFGNAYIAMNTIIEGLIGLCTYDGPDGTEPLGTSGCVLFSRSGAKTESTSSAVASSWGAVIRR